jgi:UDP-N-acetylmuramyl tripeptide synthase
MLLGLEVAAAQAVGSLSRLSGRGGGTTLPGKLLAQVDPAAVSRLAAELPHGSALVSATNGKTTTTAMVAEILALRRLAYNRSGANLLSGIASTLLSSRGAELGLFEVDEAALPDVAARLQPRLIALGNLFRDQLDRYGELELVAARWREAVAAHPETLLVLNADDPPLGQLAEGRARVVRYGLDDAAHGRGVLQHAADSTRCPVCGSPLLYTSVYVGHLGDHSCPVCGLRRQPLEIAAREIELRGLRGSSFLLELPDGRERVTLALPGLYNVYNATAAAAVASALGASPAEIAAGLERFVAAFGRFERIAVGDKTLLMLLIKNPAGANEVVATLLDGDPPARALVALNDEIADGRDVSWIWDVDFEPLLEVLEHVVVSGGRAAELALRFVYGGFPRERLELVPELEAALDRAVALTPEGGELVVLPTYTAMLALRGVASRRRLVGEFWEASR